MSAYGQGHEHMSGDTLAVWYPTCLNSNWEPFSTVTPMERREYENWNSWTHLECQKCLFPRIRNLSLSLRTLSFPSLVPALSGYTTLGINNAYAYGARGLAAFKSNDTRQIQGQSCGVPLPPLWLGLSIDWQSPYPLVNRSKCMKTKGVKSMTQSTLHYYSCHYARGLACPHAVHEYLWGLNSNGINDLSIQ